MHNEYFPLQLDLRILRVSFYDKVQPTEKFKMNIDLEEIDEKYRRTSSFRFCRRLARSSIFRSSRSTRIALAPFNFVAAIFESTACAPRVSPPFSSIRKTSNC